MDLEHYLHWLHLEPTHLAVDLHGGVNRANVLVTVRPLDFPRADAIREALGDEKAAGTRKIKCKRLCRDCIETV
jgi:hypothetical protein